jgi:hypothetical protein
MGECIETQIDLFAGRRCSAPSARHLVCQGRRPERRRIGLFHGKWFADRERHAAGSRSIDRRPSVIAVRIQNSSYQSPQWTLGRGHRQRPRSLCSGAHCRCDAGGRSRSRFFRACAGHGRTPITQIAKKLERLSIPENRKPLARGCSSLRRGSSTTPAAWSAGRSARSCVAPIDSSPGCSESRRACWSTRGHRRSAPRQPRT